MKVGMPLLYGLGSVEENIELAKKLNLDFIELNFFANSMFSSTDPNPYNKGIPTFILLSSQS